MYAASAFGCHFECPPTLCACQRTSVITAARKKPGRVAGKQAGAKYFQNYLKNKQQTGGEILGPPLRQIDTSAQHQLRAAQPPVPVQQVSLDHVQLQQQQLQISAASLLEPSNQPQSDASSLQVTSSVQPSYQYCEKYQRLLAGCLAATYLSHKPQEDAKLREGAPSSEHQQPLESGTAVQHQQHTSQRQPWQLSDYVPPDQADRLVQLLKPRRGVVVGPPVMPEGPEMVQLPPLPALHQPHRPKHLTTKSNSRSTPTNVLNNLDNSGQHSSSTQQLQHSTSTSSSSSVPSCTAGSAARRRVLHVFWDLSSLHPGGHDPRVVVSQLRRVLGCYGEVAGVYAYGIQKLFNWVPEAFMLQYAPGRLPGRRKQLGALQQHQPQELQALLQQAASDGVNLQETLGPLRCRVCGKLRDNHRQLHVHMLQRHKQAAPPLEQLLPMGALVPMVQAAVAAATQASAAADWRSQGSDDSQAPTAAQPVQQAGVSVTRDKEALVGAQVTSRKSQHTWKVADPWAMRNSSTRTLGRVNRYYNSRHDQFLPADGHQISLKYVLVRECVEVRTVQRQARAVSAAVADALHDMLQRKLLTRTVDEVQTYQDVLVTVSDKGTNTAVLDMARKAGVQSIAVCGTVKRYPGADVTLRWQWIVTGRYHNSVDV